MKIMTNKTFNDLLLQLTTQSQTIQSLLNENKRLKRDLADLQNFCINFAADNSKFNNAYNLDFPNSTERSNKGDSETPTDFSEKYF